MAEAKVAVASATAQEKVATKEEALLCEEKADEELKTVSFGVLITTAFGLVAALAWNDAIQRLIVYYLGDSKNKGVWVSVGYAFLVTVIILLLLAAIRKFYSATRKQRCALKKSTSIAL